MRYLSLLALSLLLLTGCASLTNTAGKTVATAAVSVDASMQGWMQYVKIKAPPLEQEYKVKALYERWQSAHSAALEAYAVAYKYKDLSLAEAARKTLIECQTELLNTISKLSK